MQKIVAFILLSISTHCFAQDSNTFDIESKPKPENFLPQTSREKIFSSFRAKTEKTSLTQDSLVTFGEHPFLIGALKAYQEHRPFVISPDIIWLLINQGFARHIANNAEVLRHKIVQFEGKKELTVTSNEIRLGNPKSNWEAVFPQFTQQIGSYVDSALINTLTADFTTTTPTTLIASQITIMDAMKAYFNYKVMLIGCGIPKITIEGTLHDWENVLAKTKKIAQYDLQWWTQELEPILTKIIKTKQGKFDRKFWMNMVKAHTEKTYGSPVTIDGWIVKFFPYTNEGKKTNLKSISSINSLAPEIVKAPFVLDDLINHKRYEMEFWAGFAGLSQNKNDYTLKPEIGWAVVNKNNPTILDTQAKVTDDLSIHNVYDVPEEILSMQSIGTLRISFIKDIRIPDALSKVQIRQLELSGNITTNEQLRIIKLFPNSKVFINKSK